MTETEQDLQLVLRNPQTSEEMLLPVNYRPTKRESKWKPRIATGKLLLFGLVLLITIPVMALIFSAKWQIAFGVLAVAATYGWLIFWTWPGDTAGGDSEKATRLRWFQLKQPLRYALLLGGVAWLFYMSVNLIERASHPDRVFTWWTFWGGHRIAFLVILGSFLALAAWWLRYRSLPAIWRPWLLAGLLGVLVAAAMAVGLSRYLTYDSQPNELGQRPADPEVGPNLQKTP